MRWSIATASDGRLWVRPATLAILGTADDTITRRLIARKQGGIRMTALRAAVMLTALGTPALWLRFWFVLEDASRRVWEAFVGRSSAWCRWRPRGDWLVLRHPP